MSLYSLFWGIWKFYSTFIPSLFRFIFISIFRRNKFKALPFRSFARIVGAKCNPSTFYLIAEHELTWSLQVVCYNVCGCATALLFRLQIKLSEMYTDWLDKKKFYSLKGTLIQCIKYLESSGQQLSDIYWFACLILCSTAMQWSRLTSAINCVIRIYAGYLFTIHGINSLLFIR